MNFSTMPLAAILKFEFSKISKLRFGAFLGFGICDLELLELGSWGFPHEDRPW
jgi:hypothetical protein